MTTTANDQLEGLGTYKFGWADPDVAGASARRGLSEEVVRDISARKNEPEWMLDLRLKGLKYFGRKPMPAWGADLGGIDFDNIKYFVRSTEKQAESWDDLPADIKNTYDKLGIPEAEKQRLIAGVAAQYESEVVYHKIRERRTPAAGTRPSRTGRTTSTTWSPSAPSRRRARRWSGSTATSGPRSR
jgi:Fe-S cluster assembly protein SufB